MKIEIQADGIDLNQKLRDFTLCCAGFELGNFKQRIDSVQVRLANLVNAHQGRDQFCQVRVVFAERQDVVVEAIDIDLHVAIHWALERAGWNVASRVQLEQRRLERGVIAAQALGSEGEPDRAA